MASPKATKSRYSLQHDRVSAELLSVEKARPQNSHSGFLLAPKVAASSKRFGRTTEVFKSFISPSRGTYYATHQIFINYSVNFSYIFNTFVIARCPLVHGRGGTVGARSPQYYILGQGPRVY